MNMLCRRILISAAVSCVVEAAMAADYAAMSKGSGIPESALQNYCKKIDCKYDELKDKIEATASDAGGIGALGRSESRTLQFRWAGGTNGIFAEIYDVLDLYAGEWDFVESAEIYVGKEMLVKVSGNVQRKLGAFNSAAKKTEKVEIVSGMIPLEIAERVAAAKPKEVTIRFYTRKGHVDKKGLRAHKLENVVLLAKAK